MFLSKLEYYNQTKDHIFKMLKKCNFIFTFHGDVKSKALN